MSRKLFLLAALALSTTTVACKKEAAPAGSEAAESALPGGIRLIETVAANGDDVVIPYRKYELPNGLTLILHEDDSDPLVHVDVTYHVGSAREELGRSGFAHFFEHMMFQGSENVADEEHFKIITESGGTLNGTTNGDRTNYFETVPSNQLEKMLWLEADRMGFLLDAVTQEKFEVQRETVKNERGQRVDNRPYGRVWERLGEAMFPEGHPYSWTTIGYIDDLNRADLDDLKRFFLRWYGPNNATLTIGGRFDEAETLAWVAKYFGSIPRGPEVEDAEPTRVTLDADRYTHFEDQVALPLITMEWPTVYARHPDEAPLDVLMSILGDGKTSLLYKNLVKDGLAVQAYAGHGCRELHCEFGLTALANPDAVEDLGEIERVMRASLEEFEERGVLDDDLQRVKQGIVSSMIFGLESVSSKVSSLAAYETFTGDANTIGKDIARYEAVTREDVLRVYETYVKGKHAVILSVVPEGRTDLLPHEDTWEMGERNLGSDEAGEELAMRRATDDFDRSVQPPSGANPTLTVPTTWRAELANGLPVLGAVNDETPTTAIRIRIGVGQHQEPLDKLGLASFTARMLDESTTRSSVEELANRLEKLGSSIRIGSGDNATNLTVRSLTSELDATLAIAAEKLREPAFTQADFDRVKAQILKEIEDDQTKPEVTAWNLTYRLLYGDDNAFAHPEIGSTETVQAITLDDVKAFYAANFNATNSRILAVSDLDQAALSEALAVFGDWETGEAATRELKPFPELATGTLYLIDKPGAAQSQIRIAKRSMPRDFTGDFYRSTLMNYPLGGAFNSRINLNLREDKGYTYGARAVFGGDDLTGRYLAYAGVRTDSTKASIEEFLKEITRFHAEGPTEDELAFTKLSIGQRDALEYETPSQKLGFLSDIAVYDLEEDFVTVQSSILSALTRDDAAALAYDALDPASMFVLVVGDATVIGPELETLGMPIVELLPDGQTKR